MSLVRTSISWWPWAGADADTQFSDWANGQADQSPSIEQAQTVKRIFQLIGSRYRFRVMLATLGWLAGWALALLMLIGIDALWPMGSWFRLGLLILGLIGLAITWRLLRPPARRDRPGRLHDARQFEQVHGLAHNPLVIALQLAQRPPRHSIKPSQTALGDSAVVGGGEALGGGETVGGGERSEGRKVFSGGALSSGGREVAGGGEVPSERKVCGGGDQANDLDLAQANQHPEHPEHHGHPDGPIETEPFRRALAARTADQSRAALSRLDRYARADRHAWRRAVRRLSAVGGLWIVITLLWPTLIAGGLARFGLPLGDHPPFSLTRFAIDIHPQSPKPGQDVRVTARLSGPFDQPVELVELGSKKRPTRRWVMSPAKAASRTEPNRTARPETSAPDSHTPASHAAQVNHLGPPTASYTHRFVSLNDPVGFEIEVGGGVSNGGARSHRYTIMPRAPSKPDDEAGNAKEANQTDKGHARQASAPSTAAEPDASHAREGGELVSNLPDLYEQLRRLLTQAQQLNRRAQTLSQQIQRVDHQRSMIAGKKARALARIQSKRRQLNHDTTQWSNRAQRLAKSTRRSARGFGGSPIQATLKSLAQNLNQLASRMRRSTGLKRPGPKRPNPTVQSNERTKTPGLQLLGPHFPTKQTPSETQNTANAAKRAAAGLSQALANLDHAVGNSRHGQTRRPGQPSNPEIPETQPRVAQGSMTETTTAQEKTSVIPNAIRRQVPAKYRELTAAYFNRLSHDEPRR